MFHQLIIKYIIYFLLTNNLKLSCLVIFHKCTTISLHNN